MKILQISDLHIGNGLSSTKEGKNTKKIVQLINKKWGNDTDKPIILITGDVTDSGKRSFYAITIMVLKETLLLKDGSRILKNT